MISKPGIYKINDDTEIRNPELSVKMGDRFNLFIPVLNANFFS